MFSLMSEMQKFLKLQIRQFAIAQKAKFDAKSFIFARNKSTMGSFWSENDQDFKYHIFVEIRSDDVNLTIVNLAVNH